MNRLEIAFINVFSPYKVWNRGEVLYFETDKGCRYAIDFEIEEHPLFQAYWFNLTNLDHIASPNDSSAQIPTYCFTCAAQLVSNKHREQDYSLIGLTRQGSRSAIILEQLR